VIGSGWLCRLILEGEMHAFVAWPAPQQWSTRFVSPAVSR
jgi:hypothetical protein